ncbi:MAG: nuclear transport factor 2 family protein, partial [Oscillospiraceae bacterium]|nr:nuclear transport factor 2 family protein [Oscillospiraceae bacterium]
MELNELLHRSERTAARGDIEKLINQYTQYFPMCKTESLRSLFANREDSYITVAWGTYIGSNGLDRFFFHALPQEGDQSRRLNELHISPAFSQLIEIAEDGKTAQAFWTTGGAESGKPYVETDSRMTDWDSVHGYWSWKNIKADFICENMVWKIWHLEEYNIFFSDFYKSFAEEDNPVQAFEVFPAYYKTTGDASPDIPSKRTWKYSADACFADGQPSLPVPYVHYEDLCLICNDLCQEAICPKTGSS